MLRLSSALYSIIGTSLAGSLIIASLVMGYDTATPIIIAAAIGAVAGVIGDKVSLGFVAATEERVCQHLREHLKDLPDDDRKSRLILQTMLEDEQRHGENALQAGGADFPRPVKDAMSAVSQVMTKSSYWL